jgi:hypothetical protein
MRINQIKQALSLMVIVLIIVALTGCSKVPVPNVSSEQAQAIASNVIPEIVLVKASGVPTIHQEGYWLVRYYVGDTFTEEELGWQADATTILENQGLLAQGSFQTLIFKIDDETGIILSKTATDTIPLAGPIT